MFFFITAGSAGDANALRLRILDRDMLLDYARSDQSPHTGHQVNRESHGGDRRPPRTDWLCDMVCVSLTALTYTSAISLVFNCSVDAKISPGAWSVTSALKQGERMPLRLIKERRWLIR